MQTHHYALYRFQVLGVEHCTRHGQGINHLTGREHIGEILIRVALVIVDDGVIEINRVCCVGHERIEQLNGDLLSVITDFGHLHLGWRHHHLLERVLQADVLVEQYLDLTVAHTSGIDARCRFDKHWRILVIRTTIRVTDACTSYRQHKGECI